MTGVLRRLAIIIGWTSLLYLLYQATNRWHLVQPRSLPLTALDEAIPFWPGTVVPYFLLIGGMYLPALVPDQALFRRSLAALTVATVVNTLCFALMPTIYPRPPLPEDTGFPVSWYCWLTTIDTPANCFPSGHITAPAIGCWAVATQWPRCRPWLWGGFALLALSVLTTKQHYVVDILGGAGTAWLGLRATRWLTPETTPGCGPVDRTPV
jgi:hypothetical protein